jgi:amino acid transporter
MVSQRYTMIGVTPLLYVGWKILKKTKIYKSEEVNLTENLKEIDDYHANFVPTPPGYVFPLLLGALIPCADLE